MKKCNLKDALKIYPRLLFVLDKDGSIIEVSGSLASELDLVQSKVKGLKSYRTNQFPIRKTHYKQALSGREFSFNIRISERSFETELTPIKDKHGVVIGIAGMTSDITKNLEIEQFLDEERHNIFVNQRLSSLANVTNGIAHEINNPLAIISGYAQQLETISQENAPSLERLNLITKKIVSASERCSRIIDSLKDFSRDGSHDDFKIESASDIIDATVNLCTQKYKSAGIKLKSNSVDVDLKISCRRIQLVQTLFNLLTNAFDACKVVNRPMVTIKVTELQNNIAIAVTDNGPGIPESLKNRVFEPFFTTKEVGAGVGVGLSIAKGVIEEHQGLIELESSTSNTVFIITLPKAYEQSEDKTEAS